MLTDKEKLKLYHHNWYLKHRDEQLKRAQQNRNPQKARLNYLEKKEKYGEEFSKLCRESNKRHRMKLRQLVLSKYGNNCKCCGETQQEFLAIDHMNGGGRKHREQIGNGRIYQWLKNNNFPSGFQILCHNCNHAKHAYGKCPHNSYKQ